MEKRDPPYKVFTFVLSLVLTSVLSVLAAIAALSSQYVGRSEFETIRGEFDKRFDRLSELNEETAANIHALTVALEKHMAADEARRER